MLLEQEDIAFMPISMSTDDDDHLQSIKDDTIANKVVTIMHTQCVYYVCIIAICTHVLCIRICMHS